MENEIKENNYFIIWLYISILLHLLMVIIMLSVKPTNSPCSDPDPASGNFNTTQVIFVQDEPETVTPQPTYKIATRTQGGPTISPVHSPANPKEAQFDVPESSLSDAYKKGMINQTDIQDQSPDGIVNIPKHAVIDQHVPDQPTVQDDFQQPEQQTSSLDRLKEFLQEKIDRQSTAVEKVKQATDILTQIIAQKKPQEPLQSQVQKVLSTKHRPADLGSENLSKIQLSKQTQDTANSKPKLSLNDLQQGFAQFIQNGNEQYYSGKGNAQHDDAEGLRRASYYRQLGQMYKNAHAIAPNLSHGSHHEQPHDNSVMVITIERSGKISNIQMITTCGVDSLDRHHTKIIESIGIFPPIPKYIEAPLQITATLRFLADRSYSGTFMPSRPRR